MRCECRELDSPISGPARDERLVVRRCRRNATLKVETLDGRSEQVCEKCYARHKNELYAAVRVALL